jgi:hypothetical protein
MDPTKEKLAGCALAGGVVLMVMSLFLGWVFTTAGVYRGTYTRTPITNQITDAGPMNYLPMTLLVFTIGLVLCVTSVGYGLIYNKRQASGSRRTVPDALILSRYALSPSGDLLSDWELEGADNPKFYVRMRMPDGKVAEYPVATEAYFNCGEGMAGEAEMQGRWLGRFTPYIGPRPTA